MKNYAAAESYRGFRRSSRDCKRKRQVYLNKLFLCFAAVLTAAVIGILGIGQLADAHEESGHQGESLYKSIQIQDGDTLWEIAEEYKTSEYESIYDYIDDLMAINGLVTDQIQEGQYLTVVYNNNLYHRSYIFTRISEAG